MRLSAYIINTQSVIHKLCNYAQVILRMNASILSIFYKYQWLLFFILDMQGDYGFLNKNSIAYKETVNAQLADTTKYSITKRIPDEKHTRLLEYAYGGTLTRHLRGLHKHAKPNIKVSKRTSFIDYMHNKRSIFFNRNKPAQLDVNNPEWAHVDLSEADLALLKTIKPVDLPLLDKQGIEQKYCYFYSETAYTSIAEVWLYCLNTLSKLIHSTGFLEQQSWGALGENIISNSFRTVISLIKYYVYLRTAIHNIVDCLATLFRYLSYTTVINFLQTNYLEYNTGGFSIFIIPALLKIYFFKNEVFDVYDIEARSYALSTELNKRTVTTYLSIERVASYVNPLVYNDVGAVVTGGRTDIENLSINMRVGMYCWELLNRLHDTRYSKLLYHTHREYTVELLLYLYVDQLIDNGVLRVIGKTLRVLHIYYFIKFIALLKNKNLKLFKIVLQKKNYIFHIRNIKFF